MHMAFSMHSQTQTAVSVKKRHVAFPDSNPDQSIKITSIINKLVILYFRTKSPTLQLLNER
jgi:hypothetical protein